LPENTLQAFEAAFRAGADVIEADVRATSDGGAVVIHDPDLARSSGSARQIHELTVEDVRRLAGSVPSVEEVVALAAREGGGILFEIKNLPGEPGFDPVKEGAVDAVVAALEGSGVVAVIASFNPRTIERARARSDVATGFITSAAMDPAAALSYAIEAGHEWVLPNVAAARSAHEGFIASAHGAGISVGTWVENDPAGIAELFGMGVDAVATDVPEVAVPIRDRARLETNG